MVACLNTGYTVAFGFAWRTGVSEFFAVLFCDCGYHLVFKVDEHGFHLQGVLWTFLGAVAATVAFLRVNNYVVFA